MAAMTAVPRPLRWFLVLLTCWFAPTAGAAAQSDADVAKEFRRQFVGTPRAAPTLEQRTSALQSVAGHDSAEIAKVLADAGLALEKDIERVDAERESVNQELAKLLAGQEGSAKRVLPQAQMDNYNKLRERAAKLRGEVDGMRALRGRLLQRIGELKSPTAVGYLVVEVLNAKKYPLTMKLTVARLAGSLDVPMLKELTAELERAKDPADLAAAIEGLGRIGKGAESAAPQLLRLLTHKESDVRVQAATALSRIAAASAIAPMIDLLGKEQGLAQKTVAAALEVLTGQGHGTSQQSWKTWWENEGKAQVAGGSLQLGSGTALVTQTEAKNRYFGIAQDGKSILYVLDSSGSMSQEVDRKTGGTNAGSTKTTRMEASKEELIRAIKLLDASKHFNVIWYSDLPHQWNTKMVPATPDNVRSAEEWVRVLQPNQTTNIHDALQMGFKLTGRGAFDKHYGVAVDMIFLLTDGSPTTPDGKLDSTDAILEAVRGWNQLKRVVIHCIGIGNEINAPFLQKLATENGGRFERR